MNIPNAFIEPQHPEDWERLATWRKLALWSLQLTPFSVLVGGAMLLLWMLGILDGLI